VAGGCRPLVSLNKKGSVLARGALSALQNRTYRGEATHKGNSYRGEHAAIVDKPLGVCRMPNLTLGAVAVMALQYDVADVIEFDIIYGELPYHVLMRNRTLLTSLQLDQRLVQEHLRVFLPFLAES
jgi:hypothetical protein